MSQNDDPAYVLLGTTILHILPKWNPPSLPGRIVRRSELRPQPTVFELKALGLLRDATSEETSHFDERFGDTAAHLDHFEYLKFALNKSLADRVIASKTLPQKAQLLKDLMAEWNETEGQCRVLAQSEWPPGTADPDLLTWLKRERTLMIPTWRAERLRVEIATLADPLMVEAEGMDGYATSSMRQYMLTQTWQSDNPEFMVTAQAEEWVERLRLRLRHDESKKKWSWTRSSKWLGEKVASAAIPAIVGGLSGIAGPHLEAWLRNLWTSP